MYQHIGKNTDFRTAKVPFPNQNHGRIFCLVAKKLIKINTKNRNVNNLFTFSKNRLKIGDCGDLNLHISEAKQPQKGGFG